METRINVFEKGQKAISTLFGTTGYLKKSSIEKQLIELIDLRISQINNCAYCLDMHAKDARSTGETEQRIYGLSAWKEAPYYSNRERAALAWAEAVTACNVPDEIYKRVRTELSEEELIDLTLAVTAINTWNRINVALVPQIPGTYTVGMFG